MSSDGQGRTDVRTDDRSARSETPVSDSQNTGGRNRRYPRHPNEVRDRIGVRGFLPDLDPILSEIRDDVIADLGGEAEVSAAKRQLLELALVSHGVVMLLVDEIEQKARKSIAAGHRPNPSKYKATALLSNFISTASQQYRSVGLTKKRVKRSISEYLGDRRRAQEAAQAPPEGERASSTSNGSHGEQDAAEGTS